MKRPVSTVSTHQKEYESVWLCEKYLITGVISYLKAGATPGMWNFAVLMKYSKMHFYKWIALKIASIKLLLIKGKEKKGTLHVYPNICSKQGSAVRSDQAAQVFIQSDLKISKDGHYTTSLDNLFQCWLSSWWNCFFLHLLWISLGFVYTCCLSLQCTAVKIWAPSSL